jgi:recombinational DNA repair protein (RecF pathway)
MPDRDFEPDPTEAIGWCVDCGRPIWPDTQFDTRFGEWVCHECYAGGGPSALPVVDDHG